MALILRYSMDYPGYANHGWVVPEDIVEKYNNLCDSLNLTNRPNINTDICEILINTIFDENYVMLEDNFSCFGKPVKVGDTDYIMADGETKW